MRCTKLLFTVLILLSSTGLRANPEIWQDLNRDQMQARGTTAGVRYFSANEVALRNALAQVPDKASGDFSHRLQLPLPDGSLAQFRIYESPIMADELARRYPAIKTYKVAGIDDRYATGVVDITPLGFHAMLFTSSGRIFIDPEMSTTDDIYLSRYHSSSSSRAFSCGIENLDFGDRSTHDFSPRNGARIPGSLLQYRLAVAATEEYVTAVFNPANMDPAVTQAQTAIVTAINRVNMIYERDLGITFMLVGNNDDLIEAGANVSFTNGSAFAMFDENQTWIDTVVGSGNYDIGHVFSTGAGGLAWLGSSCDNDNKAKGVSGISMPLGDPFYIDFVAHEIGHQFNAEHSFNATTMVSCDNARFAANAVEPGSGSSIMAYAGLCGTENLQMQSDATFHAASIAQIASFTAASGSCFSEIPASPADNNEPVLATIASKTIPASTAFILEGSATDADTADPMPDMLVYQWDQMDAGCATDATSFGTDNGSNALFRSYVPRQDPWRNFPALGTQLENLYDKAETLPCHSRDLDFRLTVRDGNSGQDFENVRVTVNESAGPFEITGPNSGSISAGIPFNVTWDVASTNLPPINCTNVEIDLLVFNLDYTRYSIYPLNTSASNIGGASVTITPLTAQHDRARLRVKCKDNLFYDLSDGDLEITALPPPSAITLTDDTYETQTYKTAGLTSAFAPACGAVVNCTSPPVGDDTDTGAIDYLWLLLMTGMVATVKLYRRYGLQ